MSLSVAIGQEPIVADSDQAGGQAVQQEPADKLHRADGDRLGAIFLSIFRAKGDSAVLKGLDTAVGDGHAVGVAGQVVQDLLGVPMRMELERISSREAVDRVLSQNIHGLELDQRCVELAAFALALSNRTF